MGVKNISCELFSLLAMLSFHDILNTVVMMFVRFLESPLRRVHLRLSEVELIDFEEDELTVKRSALSCVEKGWYQFFTEKRTQCLLRALAKLGGETIFTAQEKFDFLDQIHDDEMFDIAFIASVTIASVLVL